MKKVTVCVGSSCHLKGAPQVIEKIKKIINKDELSTEIELEACFCQGKCTEGVVVKFDEEIITNISPQNIEEVFYKEFKGGRV